MKKEITLALILAASLSLAACDDEMAPPAGNGSNVIIPDDECPRADGQPCK